MQWNKCKSRYSRSSILTLVLPALILTGCQPDLVIDSITTDMLIPDTSDSLWVNDSIEVTIVVKNIGNANARSSELEIEFASGTLKLYTIRALPSGEEEPKVVYEIFENAGDYTIKAWADQPLDVSESNENNNDRTFQYYVGSQ